MNTADKEYNNESPTDEYPAHDVYDFYYGKHNNYGHIRVYDDASWSLSFD